MSETLVIVTSDHSSAITYSGFATPKNFSILGMDKFLSDVDKQPYQLLMYASGPGNRHYNESLARHDIKNSYHKATIPMVWGNHDATDVPLFADGLLSISLFAGTVDQSYVAHAIAFALCIFQYDWRCEKTQEEDKVNLQLENLNVKLFDDSNDDESSTIEIFSEDDYDDYLSTTESDDSFLATSESSSIFNISEIKTFSHLDLKSQLIDSSSSKQSLSLPILCIISIINLFNF